ncbi:MAG: ankyrin repeat domain-containing protein, partial [Planctomycetes bacterium]|nr:ankyrin repeat domain-containing protein [Planctomycetota bacterium]
MSEEVARFHRIVESGSSSEFQQMLRSEINVNAPGHCERTALMVAIAARDLGKMRLLVESGAETEQTDAFNTTALRHAVEWDFEDGVGFLLGLGADRGYHPRYPLKKVDYVSHLPKLQIPDGIEEALSEEELNEEARALLSEIGQNPKVEPIISDVQSVGVLKLFLDAGDDLNQAPTGVKRDYVGMITEGDFQSSLEDYRKHKLPQNGTRNPERMDHSFWRDMIRLGCNAYAARQHFNDTDTFSKPGAVWCYDRFGSSLTQLEDRRFVQIGGEHEDGYDPDFCIYNDVVIHDGKGNFQ